MPNQLLFGLPADEIARLDAQLVATPLVARQVVMLRNSRLNDVFFIDSGIISLTVGSNGGECEVGLIGYEGVVGVSAFLVSNAISVYQGLVQAEGTARRLPAREAYGLLQTCPTFANRYYRYVDSLLNQTAQVAGCNVRHSVQERLARWLLMTRDRIHSDNLPLTQEFLAIMIGASRSGVHTTVGMLQLAGLIRQERGRIIIIDPEGLRNYACACYQIVRDLYDFDHGSAQN